MAPTKKGEDSEDEQPPVGNDEHGDPFRDYGFLKRAEEHKEAGNKDFKLKSYADAAKEYTTALQCLLTVGEDKSIVIGVKKWESVIVLRSTVHLNRSACYFKLGAWREAVDDAAACLAGNIPAETKFTHEHILADAKPKDIPAVDPRLSKATKTKAWFRMSECYLNLGFLSKANYAARKAAAACEDEKTGALIAYHRKKIVARGKQAKKLQQQQFKEYWTKLGEQQGGYMKADSSVRGKTKASWATLKSDDKRKHLDGLDGSDGDSDSEFEGLAGEIDQPMLPGAPAAALAALEDEGAAAAAPGQVMLKEWQEQRDPADVRLEQIWRRRQEEEASRAKAFEEQRSRRSAGGVRTKLPARAAPDSDDD